MGISNYGVWVAKPTVFTAQRTGKSPHGILTFADGTSKYTSTTANINVKSTTGDTRLVYWNNSSFTNPITTKLAALKPGYTSLAGTPIGKSGNRLDLLRGGLETLTDGAVLSNNIAGANNDLVDNLTAIFNAAIADKATVYLFGSQYVDSGSVAGIHDIHMNQGDSGKGFASDNGTWQDGSFILKFSDGHYEAVFLAFAEQYTQTDDGGQPITTAKTFSQLLNALAETSAAEDQAPRTDENGDSFSHRARRHQPLGPLKWVSESTSGRPSHVVVHDEDEKRRNMKGWKLVDQDRKSHEVGDNEAVNILNGKKVEFPGVKLSKNGGSVELKDGSGNTISDMVYSRFN
ncbi:hypothetical protein BJ878DRAFT_425475 [Calycina marina]|uniref:DUF2278 family protein n=1 Tax=Calycina marina TaxID=1763456 RepID=A0A9P7YZ33_9HELO|nr:hypothetical protein BJ878DRAFT_425475 [Calycina marina]